MLSDDIVGTINAGLRGAGAVGHGLVRGALLGVIAAFAIGVAIAGGPLVMAGLGMMASGAVGAGLSAVGTGLIGGIATMFGAATGAAVGPGIMLTGAAIGAGVMGVASIIPGVSDMWAGTKKALTPPPVHIHHDTPPQPSLERDQAIAREYYNPYHESGKGARLMQRGDAIQSPETYR